MSSSSPDGFLPAAYDFGDTERHPTYEVYLRPRAEGGFWAKRKPFTWRERKRFR